MRRKTVMIKPQLYRFFSAFVLLIFLFHAVKAQATMITEIDKAFNEGDASTLIRYFGSNVDISFNNTQSTYSVTQAQMVLKKFFSKNVVRSFQLEHSGKSSSSNSIFCKGQLKTAKGIFTVYLYLKPRDNIYILQEIKFEK